MCADNQYGAIDYQATVGLVQGVLLGGSRPIARVPWNEPGIRTGEYANIANAHVAVVPMIETVQALQNIDDILSVPGIDAI